MLNPSLFTDNRYYRFHSEMVKLVHRYNGCKIFMQLSPGWGRQGHPHVESPDCPAGGPSAIPLEIDMRNLTKGWEKQMKRINPMMPDLELIKGMNDEEYRAFSQAGRDVMATENPELCHVFYGDTPRELAVAEIVDLEDRFALRAFDAFDLASGFKEASGGLPVITPNFVTPAVAENAVKSGQTAMISLGRQAIADPF
ncbi:MAG: hypothetical protein ACP5SH_22405 [Syntrophobacteraceae bacterium]